MIFLPLGKLRALREVFLSPVFAFFARFGALFLSRSKQIVKKGHMKERDQFTKKELAVSSAIWTAVSVGLAAAAIWGPGPKESQKAKSSDSFGEVRNERIIDSSLHEQLTLRDRLVAPIITPTPVVTPAPTSVGQEKDAFAKKVVNGPATFYGVVDGYGPEDPLGCTGESFNPYDPKIAARAENSPFECGDKIQVCDQDSCIEVEIKDTCPGCDDFGIVVDLSYGAMQELSPGSGRVTVTMEELK